MSRANGTGKTSLWNSWIWKMAVRDSRSHRRRMFLFMGSIVLGIAALVAIESFGVNLERAIDDQAKTLMGADLLVSGRQPFPEPVEALFDSFSTEQARVTLFNSMAYFPKTSDTRLVQVRAIKGDFPFYGKIGTQPPQAATDFRTGLNAVVDESLMLQFDAQTGDTIRIGRLPLIIAGRLQKLPSEPPLASTFAPRVYIPLKLLEESELLQRGSLVRYQAYFKFEALDDVMAAVDRLDAYRQEYRLRVDTVEERKEDIGDVLENLYRFLNLVGFVALILGCIGVASAVHVYIRQKLASIAILRCVGAVARETFMIFMLQVLLMTLAGTLLGAAVGVSIQFVLPEVFADFLPVEIENVIAWGAIVRSIAIGLGLALLFALLPLLSIRNISPLLALRASFEGDGGARSDRLRLMVIFAIPVAVLAFALSQTDSLAVGFYFTLGLMVAFAVLAGVARLLMAGFKRFFPRGWSYVWRQGLANLYRPNNQTLVMMLAVGLGTFLITTLYLSHETLLQKVTFAGGGERPNLILFDIQPDQKDDVADLIRSQELPIAQEAPMVTMRLAELKGRPVDEILEDSTATQRRGLLRWEYRTTYRDSLYDSETLVAGKWIPLVDEDVEVIPLSLEEGTAQSLQVGIGDTVVWNVQGVPLISRVTSLRRVDWQRIQANFMAVFPAGALEYAPQIYILATKAETTEQSAELQRSLVQRFPNISMIDLALVLTTLDSLLSKISFVIRFMAFFSIFTGLIVLAAAVLTNRFQRIQESILLRTLGASQLQVRKIMLVEYLFLGGFAAATGLLLSLAGTGLLAYFVFDAVFIPTPWPFLLTLLVVVGLTMLIGMINSRGVLNRPPLEVLRAEA